MSLLLFAALVSASPAVQAAPAQTGIPAAPAAAKPAKPKLICHVSENDTGTRMAKRTCLTQEEWDSRVQGRSVDEMQTLPTQH
jgi:hypothetical protein